MRTIFDHIEHVKGQPHHIRKRVALTAAGGIAAVVGIVWFGASLASGTYAIHGSNFAESTGAESQTGSPVVSETSQVAGAAAALNSDTSGPARIVIVDASSTASATPASDQTTIPF